MSKVKLIVFDMAGTTIYDDGSVGKAFQEAMASKGYEVPVAFINPLMGYKKPEAIQMMLEKYEADQTKISLALITEIHDAFEQNMVKLYKEVPAVTPLPNVEKVFAELHAHGIQIGLNTGFSRIIADAIMQRLGWVSSGKVDFTVASNEVEAGRPHPFMIQSLMKQAGITNPLEVVKIGDTEVDINEGKNAGCLYAIGVTTGAFSREELLPYQPDFVLNNMIELLNIPGIIHE